MSTMNSLDIQIRKVAFWSVMLALGTAVASAFLPLDIPDGYNAEHADRVVWLVNNSGAFITAWIVQIVAMLALSGIFLGLAWEVSGRSPLSALISAIATLMATMAFIIPKFIAVWTVPLLAQSIANGAAGNEVAAQFLPLLNVSIPFSMFTSFDYMGFWLYAMAGLPIALPLFRLTLSAKIAGCALGAFGILYNGVLIAVFAGAVGQDDIGLYTGSTFGLLFFAIIAGIFIFRGERSSEA